MPSDPLRDALVRGLRPVVGVLFALALLAPAAAVAQADEDGSLCDALDIEAIGALGPLEGLTVQFGGPSICQLADASGSYVLTISPSGQSYDLMRSVAPDAEELSLEERPAIFVDGVLHVGLDDGMLSVILVGIDSDPSDDLDTLAYAIDVAELVLPAIDAGEMSDPVDGPATASLAPPEADGIEWGRIREPVTLAELIAADEAQAAIWQPLVDASGVEAERIVLLDVTATDPESGERVGTYAALRFDGADEASLRPATVAWLHAVSGGEEVTTIDLTLGGKAVIELFLGGESRGYLYVVGDTAHAVTMPEDAAARVLEALP